MNHPRHAPHAALPASMPAATPGVDESNASVAGEEDPGAALDQSGTPPALSPAARSPGAERRGPARPAGPPPVDAPEGP